MSIPLLGSTADALDPQCFRVVAPTRSDGLTVISQARIELQTSTSPPLLIIRGNRVLDDPIVRIAVEGGCDAPIRREYTVLLDPPSLKGDSVAPTAPSGSTSAAAGTGAMPQPALPSVTSGGTSSEPSRTSARSRPSSATEDSPPARRSGTSRRDRESGSKPAIARAERSARAAPPPATAAAAPARDELRLQNNNPGGVAIEDASLAALAVPRLKISSDLAFVDPGSVPPPVVGGDELQAAIAQDRRARLFATPIEEDLAPRLEADLVVAKRRLAELQSQLTAAGIAIGNASGTATVAGNAKASQTTAATSGFDWRAWLWVPGLVLVAGLFGFLLRQRRQQQQATRFASADPVTVVSTSTSDDEFDTVLPTRTVTRSDPPTLSQPLPPDTSTNAVAESSAPAAAPFAFAARQTSAEREASERLNNPLFQLSDTASNLDVSELSHITDEAQVYADLGRNDQAIELLRAHIDEQLETDRSSPAPWLMIFELYRRTNNRAGYDELAPRFRKNFNGRMPDWDNYGHELALDDGIEAFPHLVARIERDWGTPAARKFLDELLYDNRGGSRLGFSLAAYRDILLLMQVHDAMAPTTAGGPANDWESRGADDNDGTPKWDLELDMIEPPKPGELDAFMSRPPPDKS